MKLHRFYITNLHNRFGEINIDEEIWIHDPQVLNQWLRVLRYRVGDELIIFNDDEERLYKIEVIERDSVKLNLVTQLKRQIPERKIYLFWSLLKKDKNDWVLQKCTELGVHKFIPIIAHRSEKNDLNLDRAKKILIEASEQCGRSDIPDIREPISLNAAILEYSEKMDLYVAELGHHDKEIEKAESMGIFIGPEGGWDQPELELFDQAKIARINLSRFTLRAETACIIGSQKLI